MAGDDRTSPLLYEERILAYIDILGWKDRIEKSASDFSVMQTVAKAVYSLTQSEAMVRRLKSKAGPYAQITGMEFTVFSDTIVLSCLPDVVAAEILLMHLQTFCLELMTDGLYTRGAIVRGPLHHKDGVIIGPALVQAYLLETTVAKYPRIVVADGVQPGMLATFYGGADVQTGLPRDLVIEDHDTLSIVNLFRGYSFIEQPPRRLLNQIRKRVVADIGTHYADLGIRTKLGWLRKAIESELRARRNAGRRAKIRGQRAAPPR